MQHRAETHPYSTETIPRYDAIDLMYQTQIDAFHGLPRPVDLAHPGRGWTIDPAFGHGSYWYYNLDGIMAVSRFDLEFTQDIPFSSAAGDCFCIGYYGRHMLPYLGECEDGSDGTVMGCLWRNAEYRQAVRAHEHLETTSIIMLPEAARRVSLRCNCDPILLSSAIAALDGSVHVAGLATLFEDLGRAQPSAVTAYAYYESKIVEAAALIVEAWLSRNHRCALDEYDRTALDQAKRLLQDNLHCTVGSEALHRATGIGQDRLSDLFKQAEGCTPREYALRIKLAQACKLLANTDQPLAAIASSLGYARQSSFSEAFKSRYGVTPLAYRKASRRCFVQHRSSETPKRQS